MPKISLPKIAKTHPIAFWLAIILHLALLVGLVFSSIQQWEIKQHDIQKSHSKPVPKAIIIDLSEIRQEKQRLVDMQKRKDLKIKRQEQRLQALEDERYKKQKKINQLKVKTAKQEKAKTAAENKTKLAQKQTKAAEKKKKLAEVKKKLAEKKAKQAKQQQQVVEQQRKTELNKFKTEQNKRALTKEIQAEEDQEREIAQEDILNELKVNYINQIAARVKNQWRYQGAKDHWSCDIYILQDADGNVKSVNLQFCNTDDTARAKSFKDAIQRAVYKASPLPGAPDKSIFENEIIVHFRVNQ